MTINGIRREETAGKASGRKSGRPLSRMNAVTKRAVVEAGSVDELMKKIAAVD